MVIYNLICSEDHEFEGWFSSSLEFDRQQHDHLLTCPLCDSADVRRLPQASATPADVATPTLDQAWDDSQSLADFMEVLIEETDEPSEESSASARKIHYRDLPFRKIGRRASLESFQEILEDGIEILPLGLEPKLH